MKEIRNVKMLPTPFASAGSSREGVLQIIERLESTAGVPSPRTIENKKSLKKSYVFRYTLTTNRFFVTGSKHVVAYVRAPSPHLAFASFLPCETTAHKKPLRKVLRVLKSD